MSDQGSLANIVERAADRASIRTLVLCTVCGLVALVLVILWLLIGRQGAWQVPFASGAVGSLAFGLGSLAHQRLHEEETRPIPDRPRMVALLIVQRASVFAGAAGVVVLVGRVLMGLYANGAWH